MIDIIIAYDINKDNTYNKRYKEIRKVCMKYGTMIQKSVYICHINNIELKEIKDKFIDIIGEKDSIQIMHIKSVEYIKNNKEPRIKNYLTDLLIY